MNDIAKNLAAKCWSHRIDGTLIDGHLHFDYNKFAELIVRECAEICLEANDHKNILRHFGVDE